MLLRLRRGTGKRIFQTRIGLCVYVRAVCVCVYVRAVCVCVRACCVCVCTCVLCVCVYVRAVFGSCLYKPNTHTYTAYIHITPVL
jgi:hypothetical protein